MRKYRIKRKNNFCVLFPQLDSPFTFSVAEGLILALHRGRTAADRTMTIRKVVEGIGVERVLPLASPLLTRIDVVKEAKVRRAKLTFIRKAVGRASRMKERFTDVVASPEQPTVVEQPQAGPLKAES